MMNIDLDALVLLPWLKVSFSMPIMSIAVGYLWIRREFKLIKFLRKSRIDIGLLPKLRYENDTTIILLCYVKTSP